MVDDGDYSQDYEREGLAVGVVDGGDYTQDHERVALARVVALEEFVVLFVGLWVAGLNFEAVELTALVVLIKFAAFVVADSFPFLPTSTLILQCLILPSH